MPGWSSRSRPAPGRRIALVDANSAPRISSMPVRCLLEMEDGSFVECVVMRMQCEQSPQSVTMQVGRDGSLYAPRLPAELKIDLTVVAVRNVAPPNVAPIDVETAETVLKNVKRVQEANDAGLRRFAELELEDKK